jgi:hypothetical protein
MEAAPARVDVSLVHGHCQFGLNRRPVEKTKAIQETCGFAAGESYGTHRALRTHLDIAAH